MSCYVDGMWTSTRWARVVHILWRHVDRGSHPQKRDPENVSLVTSASFFLHQHHCQFANHKPSSSFSSSVYYSRAFLSKLKCHLFKDSYSDSSNYSSSHSRPKRHPSFQLNSVTSDGQESVGRTSGVCDGVL